MADTTGKAIITFWQQNIELLDNVRKNNLIKIYGYVTRTYRQGYLLTPEQVQIIKDPEDPRTPMGTIHKI